MWRMGQRRGAARAPRILAGVIVAALALGTVPRPPAAVAAVANEQTCYHDSDRIQLTFDDSADAGRTNAILDVLKQKGVRAGFFILGSWARSNPSVIDRM